MAFTQLKMAVINDLSGYGRCSLTVALPILSAMKIHCSVIPTAILSNHTDYPEYFFKDFTPYMEEYVANWRKLNLSFDGIATGFLGSLEQIAIVTHIIEEFPSDLVLIDPVMGDNGHLYDNYTDSMCNAMKKLIGHGTIITPNLTEACILGDIPYAKHICESELFALCNKISELGPTSIVITGIPAGQYIGCYVYQQGEGELILNPLITPTRPGTGDVFASVLAGAILHDYELKAGVKKATDFISSCLKHSALLDIPVNDGVCFEEFLNTL